MRAFGFQNNIELYQFTPRNPNISEIMFKKKKKTCEPLPGNS